MTGRLVSLRGIPGLSSTVKSLPQWRASQSRGPAGFVTQLADLDHNVIELITLVGGV